MRLARFSRCVLFLGGLVACSAPRPTEFINVTFTPSVETDHYQTWDFELESCVGFPDSLVDGERLHLLLVEAIREELHRLGFRQTPGEDADFRVFYELWVDDSGGPASTERHGRGRILVRDVATGRLVWRGERKALVSQAPDDAARREAVHLFVTELLQYTGKLGEPRRE